MRRLVLTSLVFCSVVRLTAGQSTPAAACSSAATCSQMVAESIAREDYEAAHNLAWRAVQTGPRNDPALMYQLARTQSLSGRPQDAIVMLQRLVAAGFRMDDVSTSEDFRRVRALPQWNALAEALNDAPSRDAAKPPTTSPAPSPPAAAPPPSAVTPPPTPTTPAPATPATPAPAIAPPADPTTKPAAPDDPKVGAAKPAARPSRAGGKPAPGETSKNAVSASAAPAAAANAGLAVPASVAQPVALAYDAVSRRFVIADDSTETLKIVDELSGNVVNLVSKGWAGAYRTSAIAIDGRRGDLWTIGVEAAGKDGFSRSAVHQLQLVSGRRLQTLRVPPEAGASRLVALAVGRTTVFALDALGRRIFALAPGAKALRVQMTIDDMESATGVTAASDTVLYVAHSTGIARVDVQARTVAPVTAASAVDLAALESIAWHEGTLFGVQRMPDGGHRAVRIALDRAGTAATGAEAVEPAAAAAVSVSNGVFYYLATSDGAGLTVRKRPAGR